MNTLAMIVVAAGKGTRMQSSVSKQYLLLDDKPILVHTLEQLQKITSIAEIVLVVGEHDVEMATSYIEQYGLSKVTAVVAGGTERQHSVRLGLQAVSDCIEWIMVHDGVRPLIAEQSIASLWEEVQHCEAAVLAVPVKDTIKIVDTNHVIQSTPDRAALWAIQTPQAFRRTLLETAHEAALAEQYIGTDDAMLVERIGQPVKVVLGEYTNIKITTPEDLIWAHTLIKEREL